MVTLRMDHVVIVVDDLDAGVEFFRELGLDEVGKADVNGPWVDRVNALDGVDVRITMMRTPDGSGQVELTEFRNPALEPTSPHPTPPNVLGLRSIMFEVEDIDDSVARLRGRGGELIGEIAQYEDVYRLCYLRGPGGAIIALAQSLHA